MGGVARVTGPKQLHQSMNSTTINRAPVTPPKNLEGSSHYFKLARAKVLTLARCDYKRIYLRGVDPFKPEIYRRKNLKNA